MGDDKKPAAPAKKDDKKPAAPAKKDDKKPAAPAAAGAWDMKAKIGDTNALDSWNAYINMPQVAVDANAKPAFGPKCMNDSWKQFLNPIIFGKMDMKPRDFADFKAIFEVLKFLNDGLANGTAKAVYQKLLGNTWWAKFKVHMKATGKKISAHMKKAGAHIKATFNKIGKATVKGGKKIGAKLKIKGEAGPKAKGGLKLKVGAKGKAKAGAKAKGGLKLKVGAKAKGGAKLKVKAKPKLKVKAKVGVKVKAKVGVKKRRLQAAKPAAPAKSDDTKGGFLPPLPTGKDTPAAKTSDAAPEVAVDAKGLPVSQYSGDVDVPKELSGDSDQTAPKTANLVKLCFMLFAALLTMY